MASPRLEDLRRRVDELARHFIPSPRATGYYTDRQYDHVRGYTLLVHAEVEACLEDLAMQTATTAYADWLSDFQPRTCLVALSSFYEGKHPGIPEDVATLMAGKDADSLRNRVKAAKDYFCAKLTQNHGIKEPQVLRMLLPLGFTLGDIDNTWMGDIHSFGATRGEMAHQTHSALSLPDPVDIVATVGRVIDGIEPIDAKLLDLQRPGV